MRANLILSRILTASVIHISTRNEHSSLHSDTRTRQILVKTSKVWDLQVFSKLVESDYMTEKTNKYSPKNANYLWLSNYSLAINRYKL